MDPNRETSTAKAPGKKIGRPTLFSKTVVAIIVGRMAEGESLRKICRDPLMPARGTVYRWLGENASFRDQYACARELLTEHWADEILEIADDGTTDYVTKVGRNGMEYEALDQEHVRRSEIRIGARKWLMSKLKPGVYGDRLEVEQTGTVTVQHELSDRERMRRMALFLMEDKGAALIIQEPAAASPAAESIDADQASDLQTVDPANK